MKNNKGFSLVELIVVIAIMAVLAAVAVIGVSVYIPKAQEANDNELLNIMSDALTSACLSEGIDQRDITASVTVLAEGKLADATGHIELTITGGGLTPAQKDKIEEIFNSVLSDDKAAFKRVEADTKIYYNNGKFALGNLPGGIYGEIFGSLDLSTQVDKVNGSTFGDIGAEGLLDRLDTVTNLAAVLAEKDEDFLNAIYDLDALAKAMGYSDSSDGDFLDAFYDMLDRKADELGTDDTDIAMYHILSNFAVLQAAQNVNKDADAYLTDLQNGTNISAIKDLMGSQDSTQSKEGLVQASMMYAMYTAYANNLPDDDPGKATALENAADTSKLLQALDDDGFQNYLKNDPQAKLDMEGYLAALDIINQSTKGNPDATADLIENGYTDPDLNDALGGLLG